jgi:hypothetical protein
MEFVGFTLGVGAFCLDGGGGFVEDYFCGGGVFY